MTEELPTYEAAPIDVAEATMRGDLIDALLTELKAAKDVWPKLSQFDQDVIIARIDNRVCYAIAQAVRTIAAKGRPTVRATIDQLTAKDGIKAVLSLSKADPQRHALLDAVGQQVVIVVADAEAFLGGELPASDPDQPDLPMAAQEAAGDDEGAQPPTTDAETAASEALNAGIDAEAELEDAELAEQRQIDAPSWVRDDGRVYDAILLIDEDWTGFGSNDAENLARIAAWSDAECEAVENFCNAVHAQILDPSAPTLPIRPDCIGGPLPGQVQDEAAPELAL